MAFMTASQARKLGLRERKVVVTIWAPAEVPMREVVDYVEDSVQTMGGSGHPDDWCFGLSDRDVRATYYRKSSS